MEEILDNQIGRGGSLKDFEYYDECGVSVIDVRENRIDEAAALCDQAQKMCRAHSCFDPMRDVRVATHQLMRGIHEMNEAYENAQYEESNA